MNTGAAPLVISADGPGSHPVHDGDRIWPETNCYIDLWVELLHALGRDPVPAFACALSTDHDGGQWTFLKVTQEDLRRLYGLEVTEENVWMPLVDTVESGLARQLLHTVEVDSWWLPDTAGTDYHRNHAKTTIVPVRFDREQRQLTYIHNSGTHSLAGDDFAGIFGLGDSPRPGLLPYVEQIRWFPDRQEPDVLLPVVREHLSRRAPGNPIDRLAGDVRSAIDWLPGAGMETFHLWAFATLRQCGATAELAADLSSHLGVELAPGAAEAAPYFLDVARGAKAVQFKMARAARGRTVEVDDLLTAMGRAWERGLDTVAESVAT
ncbi:DUF1839 family protein [Williamsia sp. 1138]|uniref:DUF1839 family protein n=1 Tax=Williamsia sp. 1138 TaxID=1903117 RepID=UPI000A10788D|nr:DUF1839 family protein [Williamsia sp. 1138]